MSVVGATVEREADQDAKSSFSEVAEGFSLLGKDWHQLAQLTPGTLFKHYTGLIGAGKGSSYQRHLSLAACESRHISAPFDHGQPWSEAGLQVREDCLGTKVGAAASKRSCADSLERFLKDFNRLRISQPLPISQTWPSLCGNIWLKARHKGFSVHHLKPYTKAFLYMFLQCFLTGRRERFPYCSISLVFLLTYKITQKHCKVRKINRFRCRPYEPIPLWFLGSHLNVSNSNSFNHKVDLLPLWLSSEDY